MKTKNRRKRKHVVTWEQLRTILIGIVCIGILIGVWFVPDEVIGYIIKIISTTTLVIIIVSCFLSVLVNE